jgi:SAM-dependent methyltransferase
MAERRRVYRVATRLDVATLSNVRLFDALAPTWDAEHGPRFGARAGVCCPRSLSSRCLRRLDRPRALDLGCGTGQTLIYRADLIVSAIGVDISLGLISCAQRNAATTHLRFQVDDAVKFCLNCCERLPVITCMFTSDESYDCRSHVNRFTVPAFAGKVGFQAIPDTADDSEQYIHRKAPR